MQLEELYSLIINDFENKSIKKYGQKQASINWRESYLKKHGFKAFGLTVPETQKIIKKYINQFQLLSFTDSLELLRKFYHSDYITTTSVGLKLLEINISSLSPKNFDFLEELSDHMKSWGPTDSFSLYIMQPLLRKYPTETKVLLKRWNESSQIWRKRISMVTFARKIGKEGKHVDFLLKLCDNLKWDKEDLVRKAVGWALKDNMVGKNKEKVLNYVRHLRKTGVSSVITLYAIRNIKGKEREKILEIKP